MSNARPAYKRRDVSAPSMATARFAPGSATSAARMKLPCGIHLSDTSCIVEGGKRISTSELCRSVSEAADRFLRRHCSKQPPHSAA